MAPITKQSSSSVFSIVNIARLVFLISVTILTSYIYNTFSSELADYSSYKSSRRVLSSISSVAFGSSTTTTSSTVLTSTTATSASSSSTTADMTGVARIPNDIFQYSLVSALTRGLTSGGPPASRLSGYGTHGVGQVSGSLNDLLLLEGQAYELADGRAKRVTNVQLPYVMVTGYDPEYRAKPQGTTRLASLRDVFTSGGPGASAKNSYAPFSVYGKFEKVQIKGGKTLENVSGTMFGIAAPAWASEISYKGFHCSFLADDKNQGGKVEEFEAKDVTVEWALTGRYHLGFPQDPEYQEMNLES